MKTRLSLVLLPLMLFTFTAAATLPAGNIVVNGDFETFNLSSPFFPPWQFSQGFNAFINMPNQVASGGNCVFIGGLSGGDMWQDLNTVAGQTYQLSFYERGDDMGQSERTSLLNVFWGTQEVVSFTEDNKVPGWNAHTFAIVATSSVTRLDFQQASATIGSYGYPGVDAVSAVAVPEPSTMGFMGIVFTIYLGNRFRGSFRGSRHLVPRACLRSGVKVARRSLRPTLDWLRDES